MNHNGLGPDILLVEDNPADVRLALEALKEGGTTTQVMHAADGEQALRILRELMAGDGDGGALPDLILLDLNLPRKDGREVLRELKTSKDFRHIPVVVLTTSAAEEDVSTCYSNAANSYVQKPVDYGKFVEIVRDIKDYWFITSTLPHIENDASA